MLYVPKKLPGSSSASEHDEAEGNDELMKTDTTENRDEHSLVGIFFCESDSEFFFFFFFFWGLGFGGWGFGVWGLGFRV
jgi:hypothetical protein